MIKGTPYDVTELSLPIRPGEEVSVLHNGETEKAVADSVAIDDYGSVFALAEDKAYRLGETAFYNEDDAQTFLSDPKSLGNGYGTADMSALPFVPGIYYVTDYNGCFARWEIFLKNCRYVIFDSTGDIRVAETKWDYWYVRGEKEDTCFKSVREAKMYIRRKEGWPGKIWTF